MVEEKVVTWTILGELSSPRKAPRGIFTINARSNDLTEVRSSWIPELGESTG